MNFQKPHYRWNGKEFAIMTTDLTNPESGGVPEWMKAASTGAKIGNIDSSDLKPPQLKMLAGMSPEVMNATPGAVPGTFWMTVLNLNLGREVTGSLILLRKTYQVWAPRGTSDQKGPLASSTNGVTWDVPDQTFKVRFQGNPEEYTWRIGKLVTDHGATKWGMSIPGDRNSKPIATLTYNMLWVIDLPNGRSQLCVLIASRTMIDPTQKFVSTTQNLGIDHYFQRYRLVQQKKTGPTGDPYFLYEYQYIGPQHDQTQAMANKALYDQYVKSGFVVDLAAEAEDIEANKPSFAEAAERVDDEEIPF